MRGSRLPGCQVAELPVAQAGKWATRQRGNLHARFVLVIALLATTASAHDFWIEPSTCRPNVGERVTAALRVGQKLAGDPMPRIPAFIDRFVIKGESGAEGPMIGRTGSDPAGIALISDAGLHWIGYQSTPYPVALEAVKFEDYLRNEG